MTSALNQTAVESLLGTPVGELVLRVRGTSRDGQVLRLQSSKCTIGSGSYCSLRLRARGVRPLHCIVVRGSGSTIVRRWSPDTLLNGRDFDEATLAPGDLLSAGPIELEVLATASLDDEPQGNASAADLTSLDLSSFDPPLQASTTEKADADWQAERRSMRGQAHDRARRMLDRLREHSTELGRQQAEWQDQVTALQQDRNAERETWQQQRDAWQSERDRWEQEQSSWKHERENLLQQSDTQQELTEGCEALSQERTALAEEQHKLDELRDDLGELRDELDSKRSQVAADAAELREHIEAFELDQAAKRTELDELRATIEDERATLSLERNEREHDRQPEPSASEAALHEQQEELTRREAEFADHQTELNAREQQLASVQKSWKSQQAEFDTRQDELTRLQQSLESQQADLKTQSEYLVERRSELAQREVRVGEQADQLTRRLTEMESSLAPAKHDREDETFAPAESSAADDHVDQAEDVNATTEDATNEDATYEDGEPADPAASDSMELSTAQFLEPEETADETPATDTPVADTADPVQPPSEQADTTADNAGDFAAEEDTDGDPDGENGPSAARDSDAEGDETINDYMQKLLARTRGVSRADSPEELLEDESPVETEDNVVGSGVDLAVVNDASTWGEGALLDAVKAEEAGPWDPNSMSPRSEAPETGTDMGALRDLANQSAKSAIDTSLFKRWKGAAACNACLSLICFVAGYLVLSNSTDELGNAYLGAAAAFVGSVYWAVQCGTLMKHASWLHSGENAGAYTTPVDAAMTDHGMPAYENVELN